MNWKKILVAAIAGSAAGSLGHYATEVSQGHAIAFTFGNIVIPALATLASTLVALFTTPPNKG